MTKDDLNAPVTSAAREYERRKANDEARTRAKWGKLGGLAVAMSDEKQSTKAWSSGAAGEVAVGARLDGLASESIRVMHDRRIPRSKANIDHIVVTPGGVWVIDTKRYVGPAPQKRVEDGVYIGYDIHDERRPCGHHRCVASGSDSPRLGSG